jgi:2,4-dienoyl-CoA reductase-like NADH-dependent reductase (Old Yellow Enzyme family)/thioredoxin reductase
LINVLYYSVQSKGERKKVTSYPNLLSAGEIGTLELPNRLFQTAMGTNLANPDGTISDESVEFYAARAAGGAALLTMGAVGVSYPRGQCQTNQVGISDHHFLPGLRRMTDAVHRNGGRISAQLHHGGTSSACDIAAGVPLLCSSLPLPRASEEGPGRDMFELLFPEELALSAISHAAPPPQFKEADQGDIARLISDFADGAARAVEAGFDAIELHAGHSYIINSFLSPAENRRRDGYGGSLQNRARLMREVIEAIRERIGRDFPMLCKINAAEFYIEGGIKLDDARVTAGVAEKAGADAITVSTIHDYRVAKALFSSFLPHEPAKLIPYAAGVKEAVSVPVVTVGRIDPDVADRAIAEGKFDFMAMGRKQIADADFARHLSTGGIRAVRPCLYDYRCLSQAMLHQPLRCAVNADVGFEKDQLLRPAKTARQVVVVGGGPAGMEAARRLALRRHSVTLLEATAELGGTARMAAIAYAPNGHLVQWLQDQMAELNVDVKLNSFASLDTIRALHPDAVIVATGATQPSPPLEGQQLPHVHDFSSLRPLLRSVDGGENNEPVVIIGGDLVGMQLAEFFQQKGRQVALVDDAPQLGWGLSPARRSVMLAEMDETEMVLHPGVTAIRIEPEAVALTDGQGEEIRLPAGTVIIAKGAAPNPVLFDQLHGVGFEAYTIGDCKEIGYIHGAVRTAADVAARI